MATSQNEKATRFISSERSLQVVSRASVAYNWLARRAERGPRKAVPHSRPSVPKHLTVAHPRVASRPLLPHLTTYRGGARTDSFPTKGGPR